MIISQGRDNHLATGKGDDADSIERPGRFHEVQSGGLDQVNDFGRRPRKIDQQHKIERRRRRFEVGNLLLSVVFVQTKVIFR